jgi:hypothetical protein
VRWPTTRSYDIGSLAYPPDTQTYFAAVQSRVTSAEPVGGSDFAPNFDDRQRAPNADLPFAASAISIKAAGACYPETMEQMTGR